MGPLKDKRGKKPRCRKAKKRRCSKAKKRRKKITGIDGVIPGKGSSRNPFDRFPKHINRVRSLVALINDQMGTLDLPLVSSKDNLPLKNLSIDYKGAKHYQVRATTANGTHMLGHSSRQLEVKSEEDNIAIRLQPMSPKRAKSSTYSEPCFSFSNFDQSRRSRREKIVPADVRKRNAIKNRNPGQRTVMKMKACEYIETLEKTPNVPDYIRNFIKILKEKKGGAEWLHIIAWSLTPMSHNPQTSANLVAGTAQDNTSMMTLEGLTDDLAQLSDDLTVEVEVMVDVLDKHLAKDIYYKIIIFYMNKRYEIKKHINAFALNDPSRLDDRYLFFHAILSLLKKNNLSSEILRSPQAHSYPLSTRSWGGSR